MSKTISLTNTIVDNCKKNDARAQMQLYDKYCDAMFIIAQRYVKDNFIAEDILRCFYKGI